MGVGSQAEQVLGIRPRPYRALLCPYGWVPLTLHSKNKAIEKSTRHSVEQRAHLITYSSPIEREWLLSELHQCDDILFDVIAYGQVDVQPHCNHLATIVVA